MLHLGQKVRMKNRAMLNEFFKNEGEVVKLHNKDERIGWIKFTTEGVSEVLNLHEVELEDIWVTENM